MSMWLSENFICKSVKDNDGDPKQIQVLMELTCCSREEIEQVLIKNGFEKQGNRWVDCKVYYKQEPFLTSRRDQQNGSFEGSVLKENLKVSIDGRGGKLMATKHAVSSTVKEQIVEEYIKTGAAYKTLAEKFGVSTWLVGETIRKYVKANPSEVLPATESLVERVNVSKSDPASESLIAALSSLDFVTLQSMYQSIKGSLDIKQAECQNLQILLKAISDILEKQ